MSDQGETASDYRNNPRRGIIVSAATAMAIAMDAPWLRLRDSPIDPSAATAAIAARCVGRIGRDATTATSNTSEMATVTMPVHPGSTHNSRLLSHVLKES